jgi:hypothetical protein
MLGSALSSTLPLPCFPIFVPLFPPLVFISGPSLPLPIMPVSPASFFIPSLLAAPPHLSPLIFVSVVSPRLPFPGTIWTLIRTLLMTSAHVFLLEVLLGCGWWEFFPCPPFFVTGVLPFISFTLFLSASAVFFFLCVAFPSTVFHPSVSTGVVVGALGRGMSWVYGPAGEGVGFVEVEAITSWCSGYLIMRASSASWAVEVAWHKCIRLYSGDASHGHCVAGHPFIGVIGSLSSPCCGGEGRAGTNITRGLSLQFIIDE